MRSSHEFPLFLYHDFLFFSRFLLFLISFPLVVDGECPNHFNKSFWVAGTSGVTISQNLCIIAKS